MALIGLISDVHSTAAPVAEALSVFRQAGVDRVYCGGDIAGYRKELAQTVALLVDNGVRSIIGNHDLAYLEKHGDEPGNPAVKFFNTLPSTIDTVIEGKRLYIVHAHPPSACHGGIKLLDKNGGLRPERVAQWAVELQDFDYDVLVVGHTHQVFAEHIGGMLVMNPGSTAFNHSCAILRLPEMTVQVIPLSGKAVERNWNWSDHVVRGEQARGAGR